MEQPPLVTKALAFAAARGFARSCQAAAVAAFYADDPNVTILVGSWRDTLPPEAPFDLLTTIEVWVTPERRALVAVRR